MNIVEINKFIKQRPPFQMIDKVLEVKPQTYGKGIKNVCVNEPYFEGHFPGLPIMPGVLIAESAAQLCSLVMAVGESSHHELLQDKIPVLIKIEAMKFVRVVIPGDTIVIEVTNVLNSNSLVKFDVAATVNESKVACGTLAFSLADRRAILG